MGISDLPCLLMLLSVCNAWRDFPIETPSVNVSDFETDFGGIPDDENSATENSRLFVEAMNVLNVRSSEAFPQGLALRENRTYFFMGGMQVADVSDLVLQIDGTFKMSSRVESFPRDDVEEEVRSCLTLTNVNNFVITSSVDFPRSGRRGVLDGTGSAWWDIPFYGYWKHGIERPILLDVKRATNFLVENVLIRDPPRFAFFGRGLMDAEFRDLSIVARRTNADGHGWIDMSAFNTDGIDVAGEHIWIHDCDIWVQDDCVAVKAHAGPTRHVLVERVNASGTGLAIGSIGPQTVSNITFRSAYLHKSWKGIYMKFGLKSKDRGLIEDVLYENIVMDGIIDWPIFIGPAQQAISSNLCKATPCSMCWPVLEPFGRLAECNVPEAPFHDITLRNIVRPLLVDRTTAFVMSLKHSFP